MKLVLLSSAPLYVQMFLRLLLQACFIYESFVFIEFREDTGLFRRSTTVLNFVEWRGF